MSQPEKKKTKCESVTSAKKRNQAPSQYESLFGWVSQRIRKPNVSQLRQPKKKLGTESV